MEQNRDLSEASITLDRSQALMTPEMSSCSLLLMFYLFSSVSQLLTAFTAIASVSSLFFCLSPHVAYLKSQFGLTDPYVSRYCSKLFTRIQALLLLACIGAVAAWLVSGHWILNNLLGISICIAFVSHVQLLNICAMLFIQLFVYDIFWVFFSERDLLGGAISGGNGSDFMMLGLGDMAIPAMLLALVFSFDHRKIRDSVNLLDINSSKGHKYIWYAPTGYAIGLVTALAVGVLTHSPQPALLYLVPSTLGPIVVISWLRKELMELWEGNIPNPNEKAHQTEV
nr:signal peptide peptidase-like 1 [Quercus suber]